MEQTEKEKTLVIDGENAAFGRLASYAAKQALQGKTIVIVNADKVVITGTRENILQKYLVYRRKGGNALKGPYFTASPERILKRIIKGMVPFHKLRGRLALKRVMCYNKIPAEFESSKKIKSGKSKIGGMSLKELASALKGRNEK